MIQIQRITMLGFSVLKDSPPSENSIIQAEIIGGSLLKDIDFLIIFAIKVFYRMEKRIN